MRILFIEDDAMNRRVVRDMLHVAGLPMAEAPGGPEGIAELERDRRYDVLLLDLRMPGMDGFDVMKALRARVDELSNIPIVVVTADVTPGIADECKAVGADEVLFKPIGMQPLFDSIAAVVIARSDPNRPVA
jgi:two-component system, OmpR family, response regulator QseB